MPEPAWHPDPVRKHELRWWDGKRWTDKVADGDAGESVDPLPRFTSPGAPGSRRLKAADKSRDRIERTEAKAAEHQAKSKEYADALKGARQGAGGSSDQALPLAEDLVGDASRLKGKALKVLLPNLSEGERIRVVILGASQQAIVGTDTRAFVIKPGFMAGATLGAEMTSWSYRNLLGVQVHKGMVTGAVVIQAPGQSGTNTKYWSSNKADDPYKAPNAIPVGGGWPEVQAGAAALRTLIDAAQAPVARVASAPQDVASQLEKLAELRAAGVLTDDEFAAAKARIIAS